MIVTLIEEDVWKQAVEAMNQGTYYSQKPKPKEAQAMTGVEKLIEAGVLSSSAIQERVPVSGWGQY